MKSETSGCGAESLGWTDGYGLTCSAVGDQRNVPNVWLSRSIDGLV